MMNQYGFLLVPLFFHFSYFLWVFSLLEVFRFPFLFSKCQMLTTVILSCKIKVLTSTGKYIEKKPIHTSHEAAPCSHHCD